MAKIDASLVAAPRSSFTWSDGMLLDSPVHWDRDPSPRVHAILLAWFGGLEVGIGGGGLASSTANGSDRQVVLARPDTELA